MATGDVELAERGRQMLNDFDTVHAASHHGAIGHGADDDLGAPAAQLVRLVAFLVVKPHPPDGRRRAGASQAP